MLCVCSEHVFAMVSPAVLVAAMRVDSVYMPGLVPTVQVSLCVDQVRLMVTNEYSVRNTPGKLDSFLSTLSLHAQRLSIGVGEAQSRHSNNLDNKKFAQRFLHKYIYMGLFKRNLHTKNKELFIPENVEQT